MSYEIEGRLLEVCTCNVLCPCWIGEDPDGGTCDSVLAYRIDKGEVEGVDVSGHTLALSVFIPGNVFEGNWKAVVYIDDQTSPEQQEAMIKVFTGQLGGAIADLAGLIGDVVSVQRAPIQFDVRGGVGTLTIGQVVRADMAAYEGPSGMTTTLNESVFSTIPGSPAYVAKAAEFTRKSKEYGLRDIALQGHNAIQGTFHFAA